MLPRANDSTLDGGSSDHIVQFYAAGSKPDEVVAFVCDGQRIGEASIVIATKEHRDLIVAGLIEVGTDVEQLIARRRLLLLDAQETLDAFMIDGAPHAVRFRTVIDAAIDSVDTSIGFRAYGDMVDVLWREGNPRGALALE